MKITASFFSPWKKAFSLVEVVIATGIASMSIVTVFGLLPSGLSVFRESMNVTVSSQIAQRLVHEAVQTDYDVLMGDNVGNAPFSFGWRYFDEQGGELAAATAEAIYHAHTRIVPVTALPSVVAAPNDSLATLTVQVAVNPGNLTIPLDTVTNLMSPPAHVAVRTYNSHIVKIK